MPFYSFSLRYANKLSLYRKDLLKNSYDPQVLLICTHQTDALGVKCHESESRNNMCTMSFIYAKNAYWELSIQVHPILFQPVLVTFYIRI